MDGTFEQLLTAAGLADIPSDMGAALGKWFVEELQLRTGEALTGDMDDDLVVEFGALMDGDNAVISKWLTTNAAEFELDPLYEQIYDSIGDRAQAARAFAQNKWIATHRPDYPHVVQATYEALARELAKAAPRVRSLYQEIE